VSGGLGTQAQVTPTPQRFGSFAGMSPSRFSMVPPAAPVLSPVVHDVQLNRIEHVVAGNGPVYRFSFFW
jgi:hypothetical protein